MGKRMAYKIYHLEGFILQSKAMGEADVALFVYTKEMGLVLVSAKSLRLARSRLRFVLQRFSEARIDIVRGKHGWRLTSAQTIHTHSHLHRHPYRRITLAAFSALLLRMVQGEEAHDELYVAYKQAITFLGTLSSRIDCANMEIYFAVNILSLLGYWKEEEGEEILFQTVGFTTEGLAAVAAKRSQLVKKVNSGLAESQL